MAIHKRVLSSISRSLTKRTFRNIVVSKKTAVSKPWSVYEPKIGPFLKRYEWPLCTPLSHDLPRAGSPCPKKIERSRGREQRPYHE
jgi:hypothetical protein